MKAASTFSFCQTAIRLKFWTESLAATPVPNPN